MAGLRECRKLQRSISRQMRDAHAIHQFGRRTRSFLDADEAAMGCGVEFFIIQQEAQVPVKKAQDVVHLMSQAP
jgi:hypothetical protein